MSWFYKHIARPILFNSDSETIHNQTLSTLGRLCQNSLGLEALRSFHGMPLLPVELFGLRFPNPVGLAAGMDKKAEAAPAWAAMGFGFCELGGVTAHPQPGNPQPRMFRAVREEALINRMGFNNPGADALAIRLREWKESGFWPAHPVGMNLGKSKITPLEQAAADYAYSFSKLRPHVDFFVVNVSSPNTPNLRQLQDKEALREILWRLREINEDGAHSVRPILVKVAPDLTFEALDEIIELAPAVKLAGIVATNTTIARPAGSDEKSARIFAESGGLSGKPLRERSTEVIRHLYKQSGGTLPIIGVGGIFNGWDAWEKITAGATLVQVYTGLVYEGPSVVREIVDGLSQCLAEAGFKSLRAAVGTAAH